MGNCPPSSDRAAEMYRLRIQEGMTLAQIGARYGIGAERVRQLVSRHARTTTNGAVDAKAIAAIARRVRREKDLAAAQAQAEVILAAYRNGEHPAQIAVRLGHRTASVKTVIADHIHRQRVGD